ncbi:uncharacterized protein LOC132039333 [Lycium ferocissimum]|uniref:uncharacterized protein LOC132039333 n=1 Tax=Lycium ferocissimum TaxID=112874 RepID=UPI002816468B|nr:uncharacterized protein LOC132039333 [Lycium ferocissimum]
METLSPCSTPKRSSKRTSLSRTKNSRYNPYADRGLDKFSALLANLEDKKQEIYTQMGSDDIAFVRFVFSNSNSIKPIVVKLKDKNQTSSSDTDDDKQMIKKNSEFVDKKTIHEVSNIPASEIDQERKVESRRRKFLRNLKLANFKKPTYYMPLAIILILVFLAVYGRCFAILCTSIGWYTIPTIKASSRRTKRKYMRKSGEKKVTICEEPKDHKLLAGKHGHKSS